MLRVQQLLYAPFLSFYSGVDSPQAAVRSAVSVSL